MGERYVQNSQQRKEFYGAIESGIHRIPWAQTQLRDGCREPGEQLWRHTLKHWSLTLSRSNHGFRGEPYYGCSIVRKY